MGRATVTSGIAARSGLKRQHFRSVDAAHLLLALSGKQRFERAGIGHAILVALHRTVSFVYMLLGSDTRSTMLKVAPDFWNKLSDWRRLALSR